MSSRLSSREFHFDALGNNPLENGGVSPMTMSDSGKRENTDLPLSQQLISLGRWAAGGLRTIMSKKKCEPGDLMVPIEKHVPYFPPQTRSGFNKKYPWAEMEIGDSFLHSASKYTATTSASKEGNRLGRKFACRAQPDGLVRIWRIK